MRVAIVGIGCRLPGGADSPDAFWQLLCAGVEAITEVPSDRFDADAVYDPVPGKAGRLYTRRGGFIDGIDAFDADFFGISPREARRIDPQQRLLLEVVWEALEDGGQPTDRLAASSTGVFVGLSSHDYATIQSRPGNRDLIDAHVNTGNAASIAANRISYLLDLRGPSLAVDTACSSSVTAVHLACRGLASGDCDLAIVGAVNALLIAEPTIGFCQASMLSVDGRCRPFDARADGYVRSEGAGAIVLKPLDRAVHNGDPIRAVIRGPRSTRTDGRPALPSRARPPRRLSSNRHFKRRASIRARCSTSRPTARGRP
jgi:phthiocerol/phenolphthiocerol synthesis type-I polyketide synthase C